MTEKAEIWDSPKALGGLQKTLNANLEVTIR